MFYGGDCLYNTFVRLVLYNYPIFKYKIPYYVLGNQMALNRKNDPNIFFHFMSNWHRSESFFTHCDFMTLLWCSLDLQMSNDQLFALPSWTKNKQQGKRGLRPAEKQDSRYETFSDFHLVVIRNSIGLEWDESWSLEVMGL